LLSAIRWNHPFWREHFDSSAAFGMGLSYAEEISRTEATIIKSSSEKLLAFWHLELTLGPPPSNWQTLLRLHHRSTALGLFGKDSGSNAVTLVVRHAFD